MSIRVTRKGRYRVTVGGIFFSQHNVDLEAIERASEILEADSSVPVKVLPPIIEVERSSSSVEVPVGDPVDPPVSDKGEDLIDFLARIQGVESPGPDAQYIMASSIEEYLDRAAEDSKQTWLVRRVYADIDGDGLEEWIGVAWRGYLLVWYRRDKNALRVGG